MLGVQVTGLSTPLTSDTLTAHFAHTDVEEVGTFHTAAVNALPNNGSSFQVRLVTSCPAVLSLNTC